MHGISTPLSQRLKEHQTSKAEVGSGTMAVSELRRSSRLHAYDSNGRDYLADKLGFSRAELEEWITSPTVKPHLKLWYQLCIGNGRRFNDAIAWINERDGEYFYDEDLLEDDLVLMCLAEGDTDEEDLDIVLEEGRQAYGNEKAKTTTWTTQNLWARTAWRVVQNNKGEDQSFEVHIKHHAAACYAFVIELLCLAFHSIAHRRSASPYESLINGSTTPGKDAKPTAQINESTSMAQEDSDASMASTEHGSSSDSRMADHISENDSSPTTPDTPMTSDISASPAVDEYLHADDQVMVEQGELSSNELSPEGFEDAGSMLYLVDENGLPITGYQRVLQEREGRSGKGGVEGM